MSLFGTLEDFSAEKNPLLTAIGSKVLGLQGQGLDAKHNIAGNILQTAGVGRTQRVGSGQPDMIRQLAVMKEQRDIQSEADKDRKALGGLYGRGTAEFNDFMNELEKFKQSQAQRLNRQF